MLNQFPWAKNASVQGWEWSPLLFQYSPLRYSPLQMMLLAHDQFSQQAIDRSSLKVINWNIAKNNHLPDWWQEFAAILQCHQPDILFLQEVRLDVTHHRPFALEGMGWHFVPNVLERDSQHHFGVLTASKSRHIRQVPLHTTHREPIVDTPKATLITEYALGQPDRTLMAANIHGINFVSTLKFQAQLNQLEAELRQHQGPIILSGDFNTWNPVRMERLQGMAQRLGLAAVPFSGKCDRQRKRFLFSDPLDHIFYRGLQVRGGSAAVIADCESSDHKPMVVEFLIQQ